MFKDAKAFSGFSTNDLEATKKFYSEVLGVGVTAAADHLTLNIAGSNGIFVYPKENHQPATYTILNFPVDDVDKAVAALKAKGVTFEKYPDLTDEEGVAHGINSGMGPDIAWFKDPAGNILSVIKSAA